MQEQKVIETLKFYMQKNKRSLTPTVKFRIESLIGMLARAKENNPIPNTKKSIKSP